MNNKQQNEEIEFIRNWTNGIENKKSENSPGEGWYRGRTLKQYKTRGN